MKKIAINYLVHTPHRKIFSKYLLYYLQRIKQSYKESIRFIIHCSYGREYWELFADMLSAEGIETIVIEYVTSFNYMNKIRMATNSTLEYSISLDEDIILSTYAWEEFIKSADTCFTDDSVLLATPLMSIEVGSTDLFIETLCGKQDDLERAYLETDFISIGKKWGVDYSSLNKYTIGSKVWDYESFYKEVETINHYYKGIHPVRISEIAQMKVAELIVNNYDEFCKNRGDSVYQKLSRPYFTNHVYIIKTEVWRNIINNISLFKDDYDEVPLNLYRRQHNMSIVYIMNCLGLHASYNTIGRFAQNRIENFLIGGLNEKINSSQG